MWITYEAQNKLMNITLKLVLLSLRSSLVITSPTDGVYLAYTLRKITVANS